MLGLFFHDSVERLLNKSHLLKFMRMKKLLLIQLLIGVIPYLAQGQATLTYSSAIDLGSSTTVFNNSSTQVQGPLNNLQDITFSNDGTRVFTVGNNGDISQYLLTVPFDVTAGITLDGAPFDAGGGATGVAFNNNGTKMFVVGAGSAVDQYNLNTPFDIRGGLVINGSSPDFNFLGLNAPTGITFNTDGSRMFISGNGGVWQFNLSTVFDVRTALGSAPLFSVVPQESAIQDVVFNADGTKMFIIGNGTIGGIPTNEINQYSLTVPFDLNTGVTFDGDPIDVSAGGFSPTGIAFDAAGTQLFTSSSANSTISQFTLSNAGFVEIAADNGAVTGSLTITISGGDTFANAGAILLNGSGFTINNLPAGLTPTGTVAFDGLSITVTFIENALNHTDNDDLSSLEFTFQDIAFTNSTASSVVNAVNASSGVGIDFFGTERPFITTWQTDNPGASSDTQIIIPIDTALVYDYNVRWEEVGNPQNSDSIMNITSIDTIDFPIPGAYRVEITGVFPRIFFNSVQDRRKILIVEQWGDNQWVSMNNAFRGCNSLTVLATDVPNLSIVTDFSGMFIQAINFNTDINNWDVSTATNMSSMFSGARIFNQPLDNWDVSNVIDMSSMFSGATDFNQDINGWNVSNVTSMVGMFNSASSFNQPLDQWDVSNVTNMSTVFANAGVFNQDISNWNVSNVTTMFAMFSGATNFNQDISNWNVNNVIDMSSMFSITGAFNRPLDQWDVSNVTSMAGMFLSASAFNQDISNWNVSNVTDMSAMFNAALAFDQPLDNWNVSNVTNMFAMFSFTSVFNQPLNNWNVSAVTNMSSMFNAALAFNQPLDDWDVSVVTDMSFIFNNTSLSTANYDSILIGWAALPALQDSVSIGAEGVNFCLGGAARDSLILNLNWEFTRDTLNCIPRPFITTWQTDNPGTSSDTQIIMPIDPNLNLVYDYNIKWEEVGNPQNSDSIMNITGIDTIEFLVPGTYRVEITGLFPRVFFNGRDDREKILTVEQWGDSQWTSMNSAFNGCSNLTIPATDTPDLSLVTDLNFMFSRATSFNDNINNWDVSNVTLMSNMFNGATAFNQPLDNWDVSSVIDMSNMFNNASSFNQNINNWNVSNVTNMSNMFQTATSFNQPLTTWDVSAVTDMSLMFNSTSSFNQNINSWNVGNVMSMSNMFNSAVAFNQPLDSWNVSSVTNMQFMFSVARDFNQDISNWDISSVTAIAGMFSGAISFDQSLAAWDVSNLTTMIQLLDNTALSTENYDSTLIGWVSLPALQNDVIVGVDGLSYCVGEAARDSLMSNFNWTFDGDMLNTMIIPVVDDIVDVFTFETTPIQLFDTIDNTMISITQAPQNGEIIFNSNQLFYQSDSLFEGADIFEYTINNQCGSNDTAQITVTSTLRNQLESTPPDEVTIGLDIGDINVDSLTSFEIILEPTSTLVPEIDTANLMITINYANSGFTGVDSILYQICDVSGCTQRLLTIRVDGLTPVEFRPDITFDVFNLVTPNGDGVNDDFRIIFIVEEEDGSRSEHSTVEGENIIVQVKIYNKWGTLLYEEDAYETDSEEHSWRGQNNLEAGSEEMLPSGTYYYALEIREEDEPTGRPLLKTAGFVVLKR